MRTRHFDRRIALGLLLMLTMGLASAFAEDSDVGKVEGTASKGEGANEKPHNPLFSNEVAAAIVAAILGAGAYVWQQFQSREQEIINYLRDKRRDLDADSDLLEIIQSLRDETLYGTAIPAKWNGQQLRRLPGFLEPIGIYLEFSLVNSKRLYHYFGDEVLLCANSNEMWTRNPGSSGHYTTSPYWKSFKRFVEKTARAGLQ